MFEESPSLETTGTPLPPAQPTASQSTRIGVVKLLALLALVVVAAAPAASAQVNRRERRETSAIRKARIEKAITETYTHRWEVGGGGGYMRFRSGPLTQKNNEVAFFMNTTYYLNRKLGVTGEIRGAYGRAKIGNTIYDIPNPQISEYPFLAGVTYRMVTKERYAIAPFALGGVALGKFDDGSKGLTATQIGLWPSAAARPAFSAGVNVDLNIFPNIALRVAPVYTGTTFGSTIQNNLGFNIGVVYRFGRQK
jgi:opacity protein-like surface antigen